jgi:hypothetical protein
VARSCGGGVTSISRRPSELGYGNRGFKRRKLDSGGGAVTPRAGAIGGGGGGGIGASGVSGGTGRKMKPQFMVRSLVGHYL